MAERAQAGSDPVAARLLNYIGPALGVGAIVVATAIGIAPGHAMGTQHAGASDYVDELHAALGIWAAALLIPLLPGAIIGALGTGRLAIGPLLVALVALALLAGFVFATGVGDEEGLDADSMFTGVALLLFMASLGAGVGFLVGYGARWLVRTLTRARA